MSRGLGRVQGKLLDALWKLHRIYGQESWPLYIILREALPRPPTRPAGAPKPHKLRRRAVEHGDRDNPSRAIRTLCRRGLVRREQDGRFALTAEGVGAFMPATVWAVRVAPSGLEWREAKVLRVTETRATLLLDDVPAVVTLRRLLSSVARSSRHRGWNFTDDREGLAETILQMVWASLYGGRPVALTAAQAATILGLPSQQGYSQDAIQAAFRERVKITHPDAGGSAEAFDAVVKARDVLLGAEPSYT